MENKYNPANKCIYCGSTRYSEEEPERALGDEHIIPDAIGGKWVLPMASCRACEKKINFFETKYINEFFEVSRPLMGTERQKSYRMTLGGRTQKMKRRDVPAFLGMIILPFPRLLGGLGDQTKHGLMLIPAADLDHRLKRAGVGSTLTFKYNALWFRKMLAKIGHATASAELGVDNFEPLLLPWIIGDADGSGLSDYVGSHSFRMGEPLTSDEACWHPHAIEIDLDRDITGRTVIVAKIRVFNHPSIPWHYVLVGFP